MITSERDNAALLALSEDQTIGRVPTSGLNVYNAPEHGGAVFGSGTHSAIRQSEYDTPSFVAVTPFNNPIVDVSSGVGASDLTTYRGSSGLFHEPTASGAEAERGRGHYDSARDTSRRSVNDISTSAAEGGATDVSKVSAQRGGEPRSGVAALGLKEREQWYRNELEAGRRAENGNVGESGSGAVRTYMPRLVSTVDEQGNPIHKVGSETPYAILGVICMEGMGPVNHCCSLCPCQRATLTDGTVHYFSSPQDYDRWIDWNYASKGKDLRL